MIIFLGIAGSGKTEQSKLLAKQFNLERISVGELLRNLNNESIKDQLNTGDLIDDDIVIGVVENVLDNIPKNREFIIDGFPRTLQEANWISNQGHNDIIVIHILLRPSIALKRLKLRNRLDDNTESIDKRISEYNQLIKPILGIFKSRGFIIHEVDGSKDINNVHNKIVSFIEEDKKKVI